MNNTEEYYAGKGCKCYAYAEFECGCGVDWTDPRVYQLERELNAANEKIAELEEQIRYYECGDFFI